MGAHCFARHVCLCVGVLTDSHKIVMCVMFPRGLTVEECCRSRLMSKTRLRDREQWCVEPGEAGGPPQLMKQGNIPCNHSIYSRCWQRGWRAGNLVKYEEILGQASIKD